MTKPFNVKYTCSNCGIQTTAETAFGRWMRGCRELESREGIVRTDCDHIILRYKTHRDGREFQLMMIVEVKEFLAEPDESQRDILSFISQTVRVRGKQMHGAKTTMSLRLKSWMLGRDVTVRNCGVHLLQFEKTSPKDSRCIKWDRRVIDEATLIGLLAFDRNPDHPELQMDEFLRDRHKKDEKQPLLFGEAS